MINNNIHSAHVFAHAYNDTWLGAGQIAPYFSFPVPDKYPLRKMNAASFMEVTTNGLLPYIETVDPTPRFMQDNDPKHTSNRFQLWLEENRINWWKTPPESPDLNPIENLWHELKEYIRRGS